MTLKNFTPENTPLDACGSWNQRNYLLDENSAYALEMALVTNRPLLVKGEPGLGKSYLALAAATQLKRAFVSEVINLNTEAQDLLWKTDPIARLNDAQLEFKKGEELHPKHYINPGILWWAFDWESANEHYSNKENCYHPIYKPQTIDEKLQNNGIVLLIDEIDKADPSLPNSLLEVLGNGGFEVPEMEVTIGTKANKKQNNKKQDSKDDKEAQNKTPPPLVIITTNDERELPPAFIRRCLVLTLKIDEDNIEKWLIDRANVHISDNECSQKVKLEAAEQLKKDREDAKKQGQAKAGLSEYLDLLTALTEMTSDLSGEKSAKQREEEQIELLQKIKHFALVKA